MATHSSVLAWRIPGTGEPGGLPSMGSHRIGHDWSHLAAAADDKESTCNAGDPVRSLYQEDPLEKEMATHSRILAWGIPWTEESGGLQSIGSKRIGHNWCDLARRHTMIWYIAQFFLVFWESPEETLWEPVAMSLNAGLVFLICSLLANPDVFQSEFSFRRT